MPETEPQTTEPKAPYHPMLGVGAVLLGAAIATFLGRLLSVGASDLRAALSLDYDTASWIGTTYNMGMMFIGPFSVFLGGLLGPRRVLLTCAGIFTVLCVLMPLGWPSPTFLVLLALAGLTAGTFYPLSLSFVLRNIPQQYALYGIGAYAFDIVATTHVAHSWEGWLMRVLSWRWIFWTDGVLASLMVCLVLYGVPPQPLPKPQPGQPRPSWIGFLSASAGAALIYGALDQGERMDWWRSSTFIAMFATGLFLIFCAVIGHFTRPNPLIDYPFLRLRNVVLLALILIFFRFALLSAVVLVPSYLGSVQGYRPEEIGPVLLWLAVPQLLAGALAVFLLERVDVRIILGIGFAMMALGCLMNASLSSAWAGASFQESQLVLSLGEGLAFNGLVGSLVLDILNSGAMSRGIDLLTFAGFFQTIRLLGGELGSSFMGFFLQKREEFHSNMVGSNVQAGAYKTMQRLRGLTVGMQATATSSDQAGQRALELLGLAVRKQAFTLAITDCFLLLACASGLCMVAISAMRSDKTQYKTLIASAKGRDA